MVSNALVQYIQRRLDSGESLSDIRLDLQRAGYSEQAIEQAIDQLEESVVVREKVLRLNPRTLPYESTLNRFREEIRHYTKPIIIAGVVLFSSIVFTLIKRINFSDVIWKQSLLVGLIYTAGFITLVLIESLLIYSLHRTSQTRPAMHLNFIHVLIGVVIGQIFTLITALSMPNVTIWLPVLLGNLLLVMILLANLNSKLSEIISSSIIYSALTYFMYILITRVYTKEVLLKLLGL
ncbi:hypothetical protein DRJ48_00535 [Candidatus Woesearchaeota archaeon]|nr:hypothetical protein [Candidatus Woesearchaeota archaeon]RLE43582.1 MAG: hypothetical protein DRJ48_00535 [Candidatus Woesearchaeota archaeon]